MEQVCVRERETERESDREREPMDDVDLINCSGPLVEQVCVCLYMCVCICVCMCEETWGVGVNILAFDPIFQSFSFEPIFWI